jgi:hypothetical protein
MAVRDFGLGEEYISAARFARPKKRLNCEPRAAATLVELA